MPIRYPRAWILLACIGASCSASTRGRPPEPDVSGEILDIDDRCPIILDCEEGFIDYDGCPDVILVFERGAAALTPQHLKIIDELADELRHRSKVAKLRIDGLFAAGETAPLAERRSQAVRDRLVALGVSAGMLETRADEAREGSSGFVSFFAVECAE